MKILLIYPPFCTPATPSYSITNLYSFLTNNSKHNFSVKDLNISFHNIKFPEFKSYFQEKNWNDYEIKAKEFLKFTKECYSKNNSNVVKGENPELFNEILKEITDEKPDVVAFSLVYSSQAFYTQALLKELKKLKITTVIGGPCVSSKLQADHVFSNEIEFLEFIEGKSIDHNTLKLNTPLDFSLYPLKDYFTPNTVIPIKTCTTCFWKRCTFCAHYAKVPYYQYPIEMIKETVIKSQQKYFFMIDDMIPTKRLLKLAEIFSPLNIKWACQLRPTKDLTYEVLETLAKSGLTMIIWGVESGSQKVLDLIDKGTIVPEIETVLKNSHSVGIRNVTYIMFGFPGATEPDFLKTIEFLEKNNENIDLISTSIFGLQKGTPVYENPIKFGISNIIEEERTVLDSKIKYELKNGLDQKKTKSLFKKYKSQIENINKYSIQMNFFREHMMCSNKK